MQTEIFRPKFFSLAKEGFSKKQISTEIFAGIIVGIVALPLAIAFAVASGVSPEKGLITAIIAGFIISFLGGSRVQIGGPTGAFIVIVYGIVQQYGINGLIISTMLAGIILIGFGLLRLGSLLKFIPHPLVVGFTSGIALIIFSTQIKDALGLEADKIPSAFIPKWESYLGNLHSVNIYAVIITLATILITVFSKKITTKIPGSFLAIILVTMVVQITGIEVNTIGTMFGEISGKFEFALPPVHLSDLKNYIEPAFTIAMLGAIESLLSAIVADGMIGSNHRSNTELVAQGIANFIAPVFGGIPATGAIARTATNIKNGARTPIAGMVHAVTLLLIMIFFGKWARLIPMSCLAGILIVVAYNMSEWRSFLSILKGSAFDVMILLTTFFLTVLVDLTVAIEIGVVMASLLFMKRMADAGKINSLEPDSDILDNYQDIPAGIEIYEISGPFFFASAKHYSEIIKSTGFRSKVLIIRMRHVPFIDSTGCKNLKYAITELKNSGITVILSGVQSEVQKELLKFGIIELTGNNTFGKFDEALEKAKSALKSKIR